MKKIKDLLSGLNGKMIQGSNAGEITELVYDSRNIVPGCAFVCLKGASFDGHDYAEQAAVEGAALLITEKKVDLGDSGSDIAVYQVEDTRLALAELSAAYFDYPARKLKVVGVTGTKGKTTTTFMIKAILEDAGHDVGLIGTIGTMIHGHMTPGSNTTPESYMIQKAFRDMVDNGCDTCVMEVSSQGLKMHRVSAIPFEIGVFTNLSPDHIGPNEHASFEEYLECKAMLFNMCKIGIFNGDDPHFKEISKNATSTVETFGMKEGDDLRASNLSLIHKPGYLGIEFDLSGRINAHVDVDQPGKFSVYNALAAAAVARHFDVPVEDIKKALHTILVKGRIEIVPVSDHFSLMIDYAHNAVALESLLQTLKEYKPKRLVTVFGCGGNRSKLRRYEMGEVSGKLSDFTIITSDNPRFEEPMAIMQDIETGMKKTNGKYIMIEDRKEAIRYAIEHGQEGDVIILAGKGHEDYQEIRGVKHPMDERELIREVLDELKQEGKTV
jgi:UDP-N-acetylmuramoyl-L-alanyl-D-glutamate--2,6-diaminopimelate ligase